MSLEVTKIVQVLMQQRDRLFAYIWTIVRDEQLVEDTIQELSILAISKGVEVEDERRLVVWLRRAARLKALEMLRQRSRSPLILDEATLDLFDSFWAEQDELPVERRINSLRECIGRLAPSNRRLLALRYFEGKKSAEVAKILGRKVDVVYTTLARIHKMLHECMRAKLAEERSHG